jgi:predicted O-linked N-acetylglucosamine transferase (SPINDLY family)
MLKKLLGSMRPPKGASAVEENDAGARLLAANRKQEALASFERAVAADPAFAPAWANLGVTLWQLRRGDEAVAKFRRALELDPENADIRVNLGEGLALNGDYAEAIAVLEEALRRNPADTRAHAAIVRPLLEICAWDAVERETRLLVKAWQRDPCGDWLKRFQAHTTLFLRLPPALQREIAVRNARAIAERARQLPTPPAPATPVARGRLRVGYVSGDFRDHATAHLTAGLFERHDRDRFEVFGYSFGRDDGSAYRKRIASAFDRFVDAQDEPLHETAGRIAGDGIHVLVDLMGYTGRARPEIFAMRPAPVQVCYLGYPTTTGADFIDYFIGDRITIPDDDRQWFTECVVRLPGSYQVNDDRQPIAEGAPTRASEGLPDDAFVFCSFNRHLKIERPVFDAWMRILRAVPGSVLWLLAGAGERTLREAAASHGVDPARLVFARHAGKPAHLARHRLADLFLDTQHVNAHTTASDALWAGLPLLTVTGQGFSARVAASLLHAIGFQELVTDRLEEYERKAIELARTPGLLADLRARLADNRKSAPLFDTTRTTRALERAYERMWAFASAGRRPEAFDVD